MSDFIECPYCGEEIKTGSIKCKHCHSALDDIIKPIINDTDKDKDGFTSNPLSAVSMGDVEQNELDKLQNGDNEKIESPDISSAVSQESIKEEVNNKEKSSTPEMQLLQEILDNVSVIRNWVSFFGWMTLLGILITVIYSCVAYT